MIYEIKINARAYDKIEAVKQILAVLIDVMNDPGLTVKTHEKISAKGNAFGTIKELPGQFQTIKPGKSMFDEMRKALE